jgi:hypothetical protein
VTGTVEMGTVHIHSPLDTILGENEFDNLSDYDEEDFFDALTTTDEEYPFQRALVRLYKSFFPII